MTVAFLKTWVHEMLRFCSSVCSSVKRIGGMVLLIGAVLSPALTFADFPPPPGYEVVTPDGSKKIWLYDQRGNKTLMIYDVPTGVTTTQAVNPSSQIVRCSNKLAILSSYNNFYILFFYDAGLSHTGTLPEGAFLGEVLFVTDTNLLLITRSGMAYTYDALTQILTVAPSIPTVLAQNYSTLTVRDIRPLPRSLPVVTVLPANNKSRISSGNPVVFSYKTKEGGWAGGGFTSDDYNTAPIETIDLSNYSSLVFGLSARVSTIKFEIIDDSNRKHVVYPKGISATERVWAIPTDVMKNVVDMSRVRFLYFIVEGTSLTGNLTIRTEPKTPLALGPSSLSPRVINPLPLQPTVTKFAPVNDVSTVHFSRRGLSMDYRTTGGWVGAVMSFDDFNTPVLETVNLSDRSSITLGLRGSAQILNGTEGNLDTVKVEVEDGAGLKFVIPLKGVLKDTEKVWSIPMNNMRNVIDITKVRFMIFVVEGAADKKGKLSVHWRPDDDLLPSTLSSSQLIPFPSGWTPRPVLPSDGSSVVVLDKRGLFADVSTGLSGWAGAGYSFDRSDTPLVETVDLSARSGIRLGLRGPALEAKIEVIDSFGSKFTTYLSGLNDKERVWEVPKASMVGKVNLASVTEIYVVIEGLNQTGRLFIYDAPPLGSSLASFTPDQENTPFAWGEVFVFPNPVTGPTATFRVDCPMADSVKLCVQSLTGHKDLDTEMTPVQRNGRAVFEYRWDVTAMDGGVYVYSLRAQKSGVPELILQKKLTIVK